MYFYCCVCSVVGRSVRIGAARSCWSERGEVWPRPSPPPQRRRHETANSGDIRQWTRGQTLAGEGRATDARIQQRRVSRRHCVSLTSRRHTPLHSWAWVHFCNSTQPSPDPTTTVYRNPTQFIIDTRQTVFQNTYFTFFSDLKNVTFYAF